MQRRNPHPPVERYEGIIFTHALRIVALVPEDLDELRQIYRIKVWKALLACRVERLRLKVGESVEEARDRYVFTCLKNQEKDLLKRRRRPETSLDAMEPTSRLESCPRVEHETVYGAVEDEAPVLPSTLSGLEVRAVVLLYRGYRQGEAARRLGIDNRKMKRVMRSVRDKMADWRPGVDEIADSQDAIEVAA